MHQGRWLVWLVLAWSLSGCTAFVARQIEHPGHDNRAELAWFRQLLEQADFQSDAMQTRQGLHLAYWYGQPRAYGFETRFKQQHKDHHTHFSLHFTFAVKPADAALLPAQGSVVLLHPWGMEGSALTTWGLSFASAGYVVVMPDLRSHGDSSDAPVGYGRREAGDIAQLIEQLRGSGKLPAPLYLFGASYGATVALFAAGRVPQVRGVVALEPYANAAAVIRKAPGSGLFGYRWLAHRITAEEVNDAIHRADRKLGLDLAAIDPGDALARSRRCTLIVRGSNDELISEAALRRLSKRSPLAAFVTVPGQSHMTLPLRTDVLFQPLLAWMQAVPAASGPCPAFILPASTATDAASAGAATKSQPH